MIVLDASALVELILDTPTGQLVATRITDPAEGLHAPHLADIEVVQALRRYVMEDTIDADTTGVALDDFRTLDLQRHAHEPLLERVWELRENLTAYDAVYVALTKVLDGVLLTCDGPSRRHQACPVVSCSFKRNALEPAGHGTARRAPSPADVLPVAGSVRGSERRAI